MTKSERFSILSPLEEFAFYGFPDFDKEQRATFFDFTEEELNLILNRLSFHSQVYCAVQIGYFKAKKLFFLFSLDKIPPHDLQFILLRYFDNKALPSFSVTKHEYYLQRKAISDLFGYQLWSRHFLPELSNRYLLKNQLAGSHKQNLIQLIRSESTLSELAALKQDAKSFGAALMGLERKKHDVLKPLYKIAQ